MNSTTVGAVRKLVTSTGTPLWVDSLAAGNPPTILGRPVIEAIDMPDIAANAFPVVFGNFNSALTAFMTECRLRCFAIRLRKQRMASFASTRAVVSAAMWSRPKPSSS